MTGWVEETLHSHWRARMEVEHLVFEGRTNLQSVVIFDNVNFGRMLLIDGVVQLSTRDEFVYHEMLAHVPLIAIDHPRRILVIGGGDGGIVREILKHPTIEHVDLCEIDSDIIKLCKLHLPEISSGSLEDDRVNIIIQDAIEYVAECENIYDAIICDTTEPVGPAKILFGEEFIKNCKRLLSDKGVFVTQNGLPFMHPSHLADTSKITQKVFTDTACYLCSQPTYFGGPFALIWAANCESIRHINSMEINKRLENRKINTKYYNAEIHSGAFMIPTYIKELFENGNNIF